LNYPDAIQKIRKQIEERSAAFSTVWRQQTSRAEVAALVDDRIASYAATGAASRKLAIDRLADGQPAGLFTVVATVNTDQGPYPVAIDLGPLLTQLLGTRVVRKALEAALQDVPEGLEPAAREQQITNIFAELDGLQRLEENLIRAAALDGHDIPRRPDADPAVVLALEPGK
jgi:hypothetical protein